MLVLRKVRSRNQYGNVESYQVSCHNLVSPWRRPKFAATYSVTAKASENFFPYQRPSQFVSPPRLMFGKCQVTRNVTVADSPVARLNFRPKAPQSCSPNG